MYAEHNYENVRVTKETSDTKMASRATPTTETVALALRELTLSHGDQTELSEFLTDYFGSDNTDYCSGK